MEEQRIKDVKQIFAFAGSRLTRGSIKKLVETPLVRVIEDLFDKNIRTTYSNANIKHDPQNPTAFISIDYDSLSDQNKKIFDDIIARDFAGFVKKSITPAKKSTPAYASIDVRMPINGDMLVVDVEKKFLEIIKDFQLQDNVHDRIPNMDKYLGEYADGYKTADGSWDLDRLKKDYGFVYDGQSGVFFQSVDALRRHNKWVRARIKNASKKLKDKNLPAAIEACNSNLRLEREGM
jgi:hypothetical protein